MALTDRAIKTAKIPNDKKQAKLHDMDGLYLLLNASGKYWRWCYTYNNKRKTMAYGTYPAVSLKEAREKNTQAHKLHHDGVDPSQHKKLKKQQAKEKEQLTANTFEAVAMQWYQIQLTRWTEKHAKTINSRLNSHVFPFIGSVPVGQLTRQQVINIIKSVIDKGTIEAAKRIAQICRQVLEYACDSGYINAVPMGNMKSLFPDHVAKPMPAILEPHKIGDLMRRMHGYQGTYIVKMALNLLPYVFLRSTEFRLARWKDIDLDAALWTIPAKDRKQRKSAKENPDNVHLVPLSTQAIKILTELKVFTGHQAHAFPSRSGKAIISENTINKALHNMGFKGKQVGHGFRAMFRTSMIEQGFNEKVLERQLAHVEKNKTIRAYDRAEHMEERTKIMQHWANYLDALRDGATVVSIGRALANKA
ncbi:MAG: integrase arm-type DNA-binding domain-containing protein [Mariprofundaceae bacterium]|nr:integrase arm-type DNA-binding domain-containing protein [Mariprofundaceae bacterium]